VSRSNLKRDDFLLIFIRLDTKGMFHLNEGRSTDYTEKYSEKCLALIEGRYERSARNFSCLLW
jgi:hypothetical protein